MPMCLNAYMRTYLRATWIALPDYSVGCGFSCIVILTCA